MLRLTVIALARLSPDSPRELARIAEGLYSRGAVLAVP